MPAGSSVATVASGSSRLRTTAAVVAFGVLVASCSTGGPRARTYYESLDLSRPELAAMQFIDSYAADDFQTVWFVLHRDAQADAAAGFSFLYFGGMVDTALFEDFEQEWSSRGFDSRSAETFDTWYYFDQLMLFADENDALLFDLPAEGVMTSVTSADPTAFSVELDGGGEVLIETESIEDRWHVRRVSYETSSGELAHWPRDPSE